MGYATPLVDYKSRILLPDGSYKGVLETDEGYVVQDLHNGTVFGVYATLEKALIMACSYRLNLLSETPQPATESTSSTPLMADPIQAPADSPDTIPEMTFDEYCALFAEPKNKSGFRFITDKLDSTGWVILRHGRAEYGRYSSVQEALQEAYTHSLNLKRKNN